MTNTRHNVAVVGTGPAGTLHAARLAAAGARVIAIGSSATHRVGTYELLSGTTAAALARLGLLRAISGRAQRCAGTVFRWPDRLFRERSGAGWNGGWVVDRHWLDPLLRDFAVGAGVSLLPASVAAVEPTRDGYLLTCRSAGARSATTVCADRLVLATGRASRLAIRCGLRRQGLRPMVAITTSRPGPFPRLGPRLLVDAAVGGWWYALGDGTTATIGYVTDIDLLAAGSDRLVATWARAAQDIDWLPTWARTAPLRGRPAGVQATEPRLGGVTVLGDAALALDPLSGHGMALAVTGALRAADEPDAYVEWLAEQRVAHDRDEVSLYAAAAHPPGAAFWLRRTPVRT